MASLNEAVALAKCVSSMFIFSSINTKHHSFQGTKQSQYSQLFSLTCCHLHALLRRLRLAGLQQVWIQGPDGQLQQITLLVGPALPPPPPSSSTTQQQQQQLPHYQQQPLPHQSLHLSGMSPPPPPPLQQQQHIEVEAGTAAPGVPAWLHDSAAALAEMSISAADCNAGSGGFSAGAVPATPGSHVSTQGTAP